MYIQDEEISEIGQIRQCSGEVVVIEGDIIQLGQFTDGRGNCAFQLIVEKVEILETSHCCNTLRDGASETVSVKSKASQHLQVADVTWNRSTERVVVKVKHLKLREFEKERRNCSVQIILIELKILQCLKAGDDRRNSASQEIAEEVHVGDLCPRCDRRRNRAEDVVVSNGE